MDEEIRAKVHELIEFCEAKGASLVAGIFHDGDVHQGMGGDALECIALCRLLTELAEERKENDAGSQKPPRPN